MENNEIKVNVVNTISVFMNISIKDISISDKLIEVLGISSINLLSISYLLEKKYHYEIDNEKLYKCKTIEDLVKIIGDGNEK